MTKQSTKLIDIEFANVRAHATLVWQWSKKSRLVRFFLLWLASTLILLGFFLAKYLANYNFLETFPHELRFPLALYALTGLAVTLGVFFWKKPQLFGGKLIAASLLSMLLVNYDTRLTAITGFFRAWLPMLPEPDRDLPLISLAFLALLLAGALWIGRLTERAMRRHPQLDHKNIIFGIWILIGLLFGGQALTTIRVLRQTVPESNVVATPLEKPADAAVPTEKPDIYYIVLDRYTNNEVLANQFNFDNQPFTSFLQDRGFRVNGDAYDNYPFTSISISSTLNARYTKDLVAPFVGNDAQSHTLYHNLIQQSSVIKALQSSGYEYHLVGSTYGATNKGPLAQHDYMSSYELKFFGKTKHLRGLESAEFAQSPLYRFAKLPREMSWWPLSLSELDDVGFIKGQLSKLEELATSPQQGGRVIFAHLLVPHDPFNFNADGSISAYKGTDNLGKPLKQKYTDQISFINAEMQKLINNIHASSNNQAVILLNSDEGAYPNDMNQTNTTAMQQGYFSFENGALKGDMRAWPTDWLQMKYGILQAAYIPRANEDDMAHLSSVNLFRIVLNRYSGYALPYLPDCHFAFSEGTNTEYRYSAINSRFGLEDSQYCRDLETVPGAQ